MRFDVQTQQWVEFDRDPRIEFDESRGVYSISWVNAQGRRSIVIVDPPVKLDVIVQARVGPASDGQGLSYTYSVHNAVTSQQRLQTLYVETKAKINGVASPDDGWYSRPLTDYLKGVLAMPEGWAWADTKYDRLGVPPGGTASGLGFKSMALPSIVACYVSGHWGGLRGLGGESGEGPAQLFDALKPITWKLPNGATVAPNERLGKMSLEERLKYLVDHLPKMLELGWIENEKVLAWYATNLKPGQTSQVRARAEADFKENLITSEVLALMTYLTR